jgi:hypothetical protein
VVKTYNLNDLKLEKFRQASALQSAKCRADLYRAAHEAEMNDPANAEIRKFFERRGKVWHPVGGGLPSVPITLAILLDPVTVNTFTSAATVLTTSSVGPFNPDYFKTEAASWEQEAMGVISTTATPTIAFGTYFGVVAGTITTVLAISPTITTASALANVDWYYKVFGRTVVSTGSTSTIIVTGFLWGNIEVLGATGATEPTQPVKNATPPTAVTSDLSSSVFLDLKATWGTSSVSNTITTNFYKLMSTYS